jgi:hypothetical protein
MVSREASNGLQKKGFPLLLSKIVFTILKTEKTLKLCAAASVFCPISIS